MVARAGLDDLLADAPARPGTPFGEPGTRALPAPDPPTDPGVVRTRDLGGET